MLVGDDDLVIIEEEMTTRVANLGMCIQTELDKLDVLKKRLQDSLCQVKMHVKRQVDWADALWGVYALVKDIVVIGLKYIIFNNATEWSMA